jgi:hypothetical protein
MTYREPKPKIGERYVEIERPTKPLYVVTVRSGRVGHLGSGVVGLSYKRGGSTAACVSIDALRLYYRYSVARVKAVHRRYSDDPKRNDLRSLAVCNNINGPVYSTAQLTSDDTKVTCGSCKRITRWR